MLPEELAGILDVPPRNFGSTLGVSRFKGLDELLVLRLGGADIVRYEHDGAESHRLLGYLRSLDGRSFARVPGPRTVDLSHLYGLRVEEEVERLVLTAGGR